MRVLGVSKSLTRSDAQVEWIASYATPFKEYDNDPTVGFLKAALQHGPSLLARLTPPILRGTPELKILDTFIASRVIGGELAREVKVGKLRRSGVSRSG